MSTPSTAPSLAKANPSTGLSALRGIEIAELLRVIAALHVEGLLTDAEYRLTRRRLVALH